MVYKRYIKKKGKIYGPYLYKSIRDSDGKVKNIYVKKAKPAASKRMKFTLHKLPRNLFLLPLVIIIAASGTMFFLQPTGLIVMEETQSQTFALNWNVTQTQQKDQSPSQVSSRATALSGYTPSRTE
jgi:hypothetical protein